MTEVLKPGEKSPFPLPEGINSGGAFADFLRPDHKNYLIMYCPMVAEDELKIIERSDVGCGFKYEGCFLVWFFKFGTELIEAPFNFFTTKENSLEEYRSEEKSLEITIVVIDPSTNMVKLVRQVETHPSTGSKFIEACHKIKAHGFNSEQFSRAFVNTYNKPIEETSKEIEFLLCKTV